jgi:hypothetical protein
MSELKNKIISRFLYKNWILKDLILLSLESSKNRLIDELYNFSPYYGSQCPENGGTLEPYINEYNQHVLKFKELINSIKNINIKIEQRKNNLFTNAQNGNIKYPYDTNFEDEELDFAFAVLNEVISEELVNSGIVTNGLTDVDMRVFE